MIEQVYIQRSEESLVIQVTDDEGQTQPSVECLKSQIFNLYDGDDEDSRSVRENWMIHAFYWSMCEVTGHSGASFLTEEEESRFIDLLRENERMNIMVHWTNFSGPFLCGLEVQLSGLNKKQQLDRFYNKKDVLLRFYFDE